MSLPSRLRHSTRQFWLACLCALALLGLQGLGQWHRLAHGAGSSGLPDLVLSTGQTGTAAFSDVWGHHSGDASCQLFDHLCDGHALAGHAAAVSGPPPQRVNRWPVPASVALAAHWKRGPRGPPTFA